MISKLFLYTEKKQINEMFVNYNTNINHFNQTSIRVLKPIIGNL